MRKGLCLLRKAEGDLGPLPPLQFSKGAPFEHSFSPVPFPAQEPNSQASLGKVHVNMDAPPGGQHPICNTESFSIQLQVGGSGQANARVRAWNNLIDCVRELSTAYCS